MSHLTSRLRPAYSFTRLASAPMAIVASSCTLSSPSSASPLVPAMLSPWPTNKYSRRMCDSLNRDLPRYRTSRVTSRPASSWTALSMWTCLQRRCAPGYEYSIKYAQLNLLIHQHQDNIHIRRSTSRSDEAARSKQGAHISLNTSAIFIINFSRYPQPHYHQRYRS